MFVPEENLKELILSYLKREETSISGLARKLEADGYKLHRLLLTGYLRALEDLGYVRERDIPPAKVYGVAGGRERNLYEVLGAVCRELTSDEPRAAHLAVAVLHRLFHRPVFLREVRECGFPSGYEAPMVEEEDRREARQHLAKAGVKIPLSEPAYVAEGRREGKVEEALGRLVVACYGVGAQVLETKQTRLGGKKGS